MRYHFGSHTLDLATRELLHDGEPIVLEPKAFALLEYLIRNRDRVVTKEELLDEIWGDRFVSESALTSQVKHARSAAGDDGRAQKVIRTLHKAGYRFVAPVVEEAVATTRRTPRDDAPLPWSTPLVKELYGRAAELDELRQRIERHRLVTITGPGGVGKTALAASLASANRSCMCELANTRDSGKIANVVLAALGEGQQSDADPLESLLRTLERSDALIVLDNCEHLLGAAGVLTREVLRRCPGVRVVATSRTPLGVDGESVQALAPLALDDAVAYFAARAADTGATVDPDDAALPELCERLDRLPLAIELAAARSRALSPSEVLDLLGDRFRLLRDVEHHGGDDRHQSLFATIAWSWEGLDPDDQQVLARLSTFVGSFTLDDARVVALEAGDPLDAVDTLGRLVSRSLLVALPAAAGRTRFRLLESVRDFAARQLADASSVRARHAAHFAHLAETLDASFQTAAIDDALGTMRGAWDNLRAAVGYAAEARDGSTVRRIVRAVGPYADVFQIYEVLDWCEHGDLDAALEAATGDEITVAADALAVKARMLAHRGDQQRAHALAARAHQRCETHATLLSVVWCAYYGGDLDLVVRSAERLLGLSRSTRGFDRGFAEGFAAIVKAVRQEADITTTSVTPADAARGVLYAQDCLTEGLRLCTADPERASALLEGVVEAAVRHDYRLHLGAAASTLTQITLPGRPPAEAMRTLRRTLQLYLDRGMWVLISADTVMAAKLLADCGDVETACRLLGAREASGYATGLSEVLRAMLEAELGSQLGSRYTELAAQGAVWRPPEAAEAAIGALDRALAGLGG